MVDNFDRIIALLKFEEPGNFYFIQVIQRKKDHKEENKRLGRNNNARLIKAYYIYSVAQLMEYKDEIIALSKLFNARVGINLNPRNDRSTALDMQVRLADSIRSGNYNVSKMYTSACGASLGTDKTWIVDIDTQSLSVIAEIIDFIRTLRPEGNEKLLASIPTKSGYHLITKRFDGQTFKQKFPEVEIHKNNPTCLYVP